MLRLGIDIGGSSIKLGIVEDNDGKVISYSDIKFVYGAWDKNLANVKDATYDMLSKNNLKLSDIESIGIGVPGLLDKNCEVLEEAYNLGLSKINIKKDFENLFSPLKITIVNDADAAGLCEYYFGIFKGRENACLLTLGTGLGGCVILNGKLFTGGNKRGIELGHMKIEKDGNLCTCGGRGCAESYVSASALSNNIKKLYDETKDETILNAAGRKIENINSKTLMDLAKNNHEGAKKIVDEFAQNLSIVISNICVLYDPEIIGLGGGVSSSYELWFDKLIKKVKEKTFAGREFEIKIAKYGADAGFIGAAMAGK